VSSNPHILLIAIGPVQPFIAAARKIRDLWQGSLMLERLSKAAAMALHGHGEKLGAPCEFIFP
jgi:CRISPR-associated protein Cmr2